MPLNGLQRFSLIDYPGRLACVAFFGNCNFRCPFCHNPALVFDPASQGEITPEAFAAFLDGRRGRLDGVVFSGGEPTLDTSLPQYAKIAKERGFTIKLDTNGSHPEVIRALFRAGLLDALGIDCKAPRAKYAALSGSCDSAVAEKVAESFRFAVAAKIELDVRTTVHRALLSEDDLQVMSRELSALGVRNWVLQQFHRAELIDDSLNDKPTYSDRELAAIAARLGGGVRTRGTLLA